MNELFQIRPVLLIQAGNIVSIDAGEVGFNHLGAAPHDAQSCPVVERLKGRRGQVLPFAVSPCSLPSWHALFVSNSPARCITSPRAAIGASRSLWTITIDMGFWTWWRRRFRASTPRSSPIA